MLPSRADILSAVSKWGVSPGSFRLSALRLLGLLPLLNRPASLSRQLLRCFVPRGEQGDQPPLGPGRVGCAAHADERSQSPDQGRRRDHRSPNSVRGQRPGGAPQAQPRRAALETDASDGRAVEVRRSAGRRGWPRPAVAGCRIDRLACWRSPRRRCGRADDTVRLAGPHEQVHI
jgi:hypothetical protein